MEAFIGRLPQSIEGNITASKPQTLEEAINISQRLMDQIIKRDSIQETNDRKTKMRIKEKHRPTNNFQNKLHGNNRNNDYHQQQNRRQEIFNVYTATNGYTGNRPLCERCTLHHIGPCTVKCRTCNRDIMRISDQKQITGPQESILRDEVAFVHCNNKVEPQESMQCQMISIPLGLSVVGYSDGVALNMDCFDEGEHTQIDDIDNNGYLLNDEEDETDPTNAFNQSIRYFILGKTFKNLDVAYDFYNEYGLSKGFGIRKNQVYWHKKTNEIYRRTFVYNKEGFKDMNDKRHLGDNVKRRCITRTGCEAMMQVTLLHGQWVVDKFISEHNHPFDLPSHALKQRSYSIFHRSHECKDVVSLLSNAGMKPSEITKVMNAFRGNEEDNLTRVQCSNIASNKRKYNIGKERYGIIMHFKGRTEIDKEFYFDMDLSKDGTLKSVFWADGRSRYSYCQFHDVLVFDTTYKTNKFSFPFAPFVGVNHHGPRRHLHGILKLSQDLNGDRPSLQRYQERACPSKHNSVVVN
ncbi:FAR1-related sequence 5-like protein [Tanacetum coccineum]